MYPFCITSWLKVVTSLGHLPMCVWKTIFDGAIGTGNYAYTRVKIAAALSFSSCTLTAEVIQCIDPFLCPCVVTCKKCLRPSVGVSTLNMISAWRDTTVGLLAIYILFYPRLKPPYLKGVLGIHFERGSAVSHSGMNTPLFSDLPQFLPVF